MSTMLEQKGREHAIIRQRIKEAFGLEDDDQALADSLEGESDFTELCVKALREALYREAQGDAMKAVIDDNRIRQKRHYEAAQRVRQIVADAMTEAGETKIPAPDMTITLRRGTPSVVITGAAEDIPQEYVRVKVEAAPDKSKILAELKEGKTLSFAYLSNPAPVLHVSNK